MLHRRFINQIRLVCGRYHCSVLYLGGLLSWPFASRPSDSLLWGYELGALNNPKSTHITPCLALGKMRSFPDQLG
jgi:hypothetical protein